MHEEDGYTGPATVIVADTEVPVDVELRGVFQPIDGYYRWYGRVRPNARLRELAGITKTTVLVRTPAGEATGELSDVDPWGRYRITGSSRPPFPVPTSTDQVEVSP
jgi:hypothetical protein